MPVNFGRDIAPRQIQAIASYDYVDIAEGTGIVVFHGGSKASASAAYTYSLSRNTFYSNEIASGGIAAGTADTKVFDKNFDVVFLKPQIIEGRALINIPIAVSGNTPASSYDVYTTVGVFKVSQGVTTELFALTSGSLLHSAESFQFGYSAIEANLPISHFSANDTLRLRVQLYGRGNAADSAYALVGMDPKLRTQSGALSGETLSWIEGDSDLQFHVPFRLNT